MNKKVYFAAFSLYLFALAGAYATPGVPPSGSRFEQTVAHVMRAEPELRAVFATAALDQLSLAYDEEASLAVQQARAGRDSADLMNWAAAVQRYARQFDLLIEDVASGFPVSLANSADSPVSVSVAGRTVMLTHPRTDYQTLYEQAVLEEFCRQHSCEDIAAADSETGAGAITVGPVRPVWGFSSAGPVCSLSGISVAFPIQASLPEARAFCAQWMREVFLLADEMAWQVRHGVRIEWDNLMIHPIPGREGERLQLNSAGDSILAVTQLIAAHPDGLKAVMPWLQDQVVGGGQQTLQIDANVLGWQR